jgi:chromate transporter
MNMLFELFIVFFKLGAFTIGGGVAMLPLLQNVLIKEKKWFTEEEFMDVVAVTQSLPGVIAVNMATYVGYKKKGFLGSLVSTIGVVLPSFVLILIMARAISFAGDNSVIKGAMAALRATALGLIAVAIFQLAPVAIKNKWAVLSAVASFVMIIVFDINTAYVILIFLLLGIASAIVGSKRIQSAEADIADASHERADEEGGEPK